MANLYTWTCSECGHEYRARAWETDCERCHSPWAFISPEPTTPEEPPTMPTTDDLTGATYTLKGHFAPGETATVLGRDGLFPGTDRWLVETSGNRRWGCSGDSIRKALADDHATPEAIPPDCKLRQGISRMECSCVACLALHAANKAKADALHAARDAAQHTCKPVTVENVTPKLLMILCDRRHVVSTMDVKEWAGSRMEATIGSHQARDAAQRADEAALPYNSAEAETARQNALCMCGHPRYTHYKNWDACVRCKCTGMVYDCRPPEGYEPPSAQDAGRIVYPVPPGQCSHPSAVREGPRLRCPDCGAWLLGPMGSAPPRAARDRSTLAP